MFFKNGWLPLMTQRPIPKEVAADVRLRSGEAGLHVERASSLSVLWHS